MTRFLVILDYDGVIVDSLDFCLKCSREVLEQFGGQQVPEKQDWERLDDITWEGIGRQAGLSESVLPDFKQAAHHKLEEGAAGIPLFPGMAETVRKLSLSFTLAVVTANISTVVAEVLARENVTNCIDAVAGADTPGPKSEKILKTMRKTGIEAGSTIMVGDTVSDIRQAREAGVGIVAVSWGWHPLAFLERERPDSIVHSPAELANHLRLIAGSDRS